MHLGSSIWLKPLRFEISIAVFLGTLACVAVLLPASVRAARWFGVYMAGVVAALLAEIVWIGGAAAVGTPSHDDDTVPFLRAIYPLMGVIAAFGTSGAAVMAWHVMREADAPPGRAVRRAVSLGLWLTFALTLVTAFTLGFQTGHEIGGDGSDVGGWPLFGWSRDAGDLRVAHFFATHAMQVVPVAALLVAAALPRSRGLAAAWTVAGLYAALILATYAEALMDRPFLGRLV